MPAVGNASVVPGESVDGPPTMGRVRAVVILKAGSGIGSRRRPSKAARWRASMICVVEGLESSSLGVF